MKCMCTLAGWMGRRGGLQGLNKMGWGGVRVAGPEQDGMGKRGVAGPEQDGMGRREGGLQGLNKM